MTDWDKYPNFIESEFTCHCGCGGAPMTDAFMTLLQKLRDVVGPMYINSGYRCPDYNDKISGSGTTGAHTLGVAADISVPDGRFAHSLLAAAFGMGVPRLGVKVSGRGGKFIHLDISNKHPQSVVWGY